MSEIISLQVKYASRIRLDTRFYPYDPRCLHARVPLCGGHFPRRKNGLQESTIIPAGNTVYTETVRFSHLFDFRAEFIHGLAHIPVDRCAVL